jgi:hypothetical protein
LNKAQDRHLALRPTNSSYYNRQKAFFNDSIANYWHLSGPLQFSRHFFWESKARPDHAIAAKSLSRASHQDAKKPNARPLVQIPT